MWLHLAANKFALSFRTRGGRIEWLGAVLALPFGIAAASLGLAAIQFPDPFSLQSAHLVSGSFFAAGMALGIYGSAWAFSATEPHNRLAAYSAVLDAMACLALAVVIEWYFYTALLRPRSLVPFAIPAAFWLVGTLLLLPAARARRGRGSEETEE